MIFEGLNENEIGNIAYLIEMVDGVEKVLVKECTARFGIIQKAASTEEK